MHAGSRLTLLCVLIASTSSWVVDLLVMTDFNEVNISGKEVTDLYIASMTRPLTPVSMLILIWIAGMTVRTIKQLWTQGASVYFTNGWNVMDFVQLILYWIFVIAGITAYFKSLDIAEAEGIFARVPDIKQALSGANTSAHTPESATELPGATVTSNNEMQDTEHTWQDFQAQLVSEAAFAIANVLSFLQILHHLLAFALLGPLLVSFTGMAYDVLKFFMIFCCLLVSFSIGMTQLYHKFEALEVKACHLEAETCGDTPFLNFGKSMVTLFWSLFDMVDLGTLRVNDSLVVTNTVGSIMYAAFMLIGSIVLLNALIAMMSNTYTRVEENSEVEWKLARTKIMAEYISEKASLPPPFNLVPTVKFVLWLFRYIPRKLRRSGCPASQQFRATDQEGLQNAAYKEASLVLGERCLRAMDMERSESQTSSDLKTLKNSVEKFSCEMMRIQQQLTCILEILNQTKGVVETGDCPAEEATIADKTSR
ncbi:short transient receptor potential channel 4-like isoform X2 [Patiria miniata]|uniref:Ion transport domain-containing protein n=1 Tax=Patiria miniata TaxID=46514 RepID=A0A914BNF7_PATMI|nr:short transient receptor potential channel 4-like isoform X2 [Patiria miniata]